MAMAGAGAAGAAALAIAPSAVAAPAAQEKTTLPAGAKGALGAHVRDVAKGEVTLMIEGHEVVVTDRALVARLAHAYAKAQHA